MLNTVHTRLSLLVLMCGYYSLSFDFDGVRFILYDNVFGIGYFARCHIYFARAAVTGSVLIQIIIGNYMHSTPLFFGSVAPSLIGC